MPLALSAELRTKRARLASLSRSQPEVAEKLKIEYEKDAREERIRRLADADPPLSAERRARIAAYLVSPSTSDGGDGA